MALVDYLTALRGAIGWVMKKFVFSISMIVTTFFRVQSVEAQVSTWQHVNLMSTTGIKVGIDYQMHPQCIRYDKDGRRDFLARVAAPVWVNVYGVNANARVEVEIQSYKQDMIAHGGGQNPVVRTYEHYDRTIQLQRADATRYTGNLGIVATRVTSGSARLEERIMQRVQVRINGVPLMDPISRTDAFGISMYDRIPCR